MKGQQLINTTALGLLTILIVSCGSSSGEIAATYVSPTQYGSFTCEQLALELDRLNRRKTALAADIDKKASSDEGMTAVSAILFWPAAFALGGNEAQEAEYARLKGEYDAVQQSGIEKNCILSPSKPQIAKTVSSLSVSVSSGALEFYGQAEEEVDSGNYDKNMWAKALVEVEGDETKRKARYIALRANQLYIENGGSVSSISSYEQENKNTEVSGIDVSGNYVSEITTNSKWQFLKKYKDLKITVTQSENKITATNNRYKTKIEGILEGDVIKFHVNASVVSGFYDAEGEWKLKDDRTGFEGKWRTLGGPDAGSGTWNLNKLD